MISELIAESKDILNSDIHVYDKYKYYQCPTGMSANSI